MSTSAQLITLPAFFDDRGAFVKTFNESWFNDLGISFSLRESYFSVSKKDVIRGMHFHVPPHAHAKIVFCPKGAILDVVVDLRKDSPDYGKAFSFTLSARNAQALYIPEGFAHGFKALEDDSITYYLVSGMYVAEADHGIAYDSIDFDWDCAEPLLSARDKQFVTLSDYKSPFSI